MANLSSVLILVSLEVLIISFFQLVKDNELDRVTKRKCIYPIPDLKLALGPNPKDPLSPRF